MLKLFHKFKRVIVASIDRVQMSADEKRRLQHYSVFLIVGIPIMIIFGFHNLVKGNYVLCIFVFFSASGLTCGWLFLRNMKKGKIVYRANTFLFSLLILYMLFVGGEGGSKILWMYTFPLISFFLFGKYEGLFWSVMLILITSLLFLNPFELTKAYAYPDEFKIRFIASYICVTAVTYWFEYFRYRYRIELEIKNKNLKREIDERNKAEKEREELIIELKKALNEVKTLSGFLPICASCKKIRDDKGYWNQIEGYILSHSNAELSHSICPDCVKKLYPDFV